MSIRSHAEWSMRLLWRQPSNPIAWWWALLTLSSIGNIALWFLVYGQFRMEPTDSTVSALHTDLMLYLCAAYVFGCAFRSFLPRADVQRICLFDTWLSRVLIGRSVGTVGGVCLAAQWAIFFYRLCYSRGVDTTVNEAWMIVL